jgi:NTP pyrophosphatase (non-canonical NTP hydrolase)
VEITPQSAVPQCPPSLMHEIEHHNLHTLFQISLKGVMTEAHENAIAKGFWNDDKPAVTHLVDDNRLLRIHGEVTELGEALRDGNPPCPKKGMEGFTSAEEESADVAIRLFDYCERRGHRLPEAITAKMAVNATRPPLHGRLFS